MYLEAYSDLIEIRVTNVWQSVDLQNDSIVHKYSKVGVSLGIVAYRHIQSFLLES